jgi:hypothetical protein
MRLKLVESTHQLRDLIARSRQGDERRLPDDAGTWFDVLSCKQTMLLDGNTRRDVVRIAGTRYYAELVVSEDGNVLRCSRCRSISWNFGQLAQLEWLDQQLGGDCTCFKDAGVIYI